MVSSQEKALKKIKEGVFDVIPSGSVDTLTSEDFRLLLNGVGDINVTTLISYTSFNDESGGGLHNYRVFFFLWIQSGGCKSAILRSFMLFLYFLHSKIWAHFHFGTFDP